MLEVPDRRGSSVVPEPRSTYALRFFLLAAFLFVVAAGVSFVLLKWFPPVVTIGPSRFSRAFGFSTLFLFSGSGCLFRAVESVRRERQRAFRSWLILALTSGTLFVATQAYALICLIRHQPVDEATEGAAAFVAVFATLHAMHFLVALMFLCHITVQAMADRYDHEYYWGVTVSAWFWHVLGIVWMAILFVMMIARYYS
jgi:heme/copper-type cytochrome/quinol oxidase subunit 3